MYQTQIQNLKSVDFIEKTGIGKKFSL